VNLGELKEDCWISL